MTIKGKKLTPQRIVRKIKYTLKSSYEFGMLHLALVTRNAKLAAKIMVKAGWPAEPEGNGAKKRPRVLCLGRTIFVDDIKALTMYSGKLDYFVIHLKYFNKCVKFFLTKEKANAMTEFNYYTDGMAEIVHERGGKFFDELLKLLIKKLGISAILTGNYSYTQQQELARACLEQNFPFIVLHKEGMEKFREDPQIFYKDFRFVGTKMVFYNEGVRELFLGMPLPGLTRENSGVVGIPRLDYYHHATFDNPKQQITLFTIHPQSYMTFLMKDEVKMAAVEKRTGEFYQLAIEFADRHPEITVVIKTKAAKFYSEQVKAIREELYGDKEMPNLIITNAADPKTLIKESLAILSYNSTTLIEAILAGKMIITADFRDIIPDPKWDYFGSYSGLVHYVKTIDQLEELMSNPKKNSEVDTKERDAFLRELIYYHDGKASERSEAEILKSIEEAQNGN